ncbi:hypothetical protein KKG65_03825 [Patescibacteria group bacterium]|nr:hypothetical protein [Patescibacteria group bacterium]
MPTSTMVSFGDVFNYQGDNYVFLADSPEKKIVYAARILDHQASKKLQKLHDRYEFKSNYVPDSMTWAFVVLKTKDFQDCVAWLNNPGHDNSHLCAAHSKLDEDDLIELKKQVLERNLPPDLKEKLKQTT